MVYEPRVSGIAAVYRVQLASFRYDFYENRKSHLGAMDDTREASMMLQAQRTLPLHGIRPAWHFPARTERLVAAQYLMDRSTFLNQCRC